MADINIPHFAYPVRFGVGGSIATVEQNSVEDVMNCVAAACKTERGSRLYVPGFGIDDPTFEEVPLDTTTLLAQIRESEPRSNNIADETITELVDTLKIGVGITQ